jgi:hypothetical protein
MRHLPTLFVVLCLALFLAAPAAQAQAPSPYAADVVSIDSIIAALYGVISGPAGQARDWDRPRNLFAPGARLIPAAPRGDGAAPAAISPGDYVQRTSESFLKNGFLGASPTISRLRMNARCRVSSDASASNDSDSLCARR